MKQSIKVIATIAVLIMNFGMASAQNAADKILGTYSVVSDVSKEVVKVNISKKGDTYQAQIFWMEKPLTADGEIKRDRYNPDPALRSVPGDKIVLAWGLKYDSKANEWSGGKIYDPDSGKIYKTVFKFESPTNLKVRGYIGMPAFGRTMNWKKID